ncbi:MAG: hypothetical protein MJA83_03030, partial [Gammaproteobacteria bacterium]|nr:hypothetical protein [Gammaproteobacteria bacterium]
MAASAEKAGGVSAAQATPTPGEKVVLFPREGENLFQKPKVHNTVLESLPLRVRSRDPIESNTRSLTFVIPRASGLFTALSRTYMRLKLKLVDVGNVLTAAPVNLIGSSLFRSCSVKIGGYTVPELSLDNYYGYEAFCATMFGYAPHNQHLVNRGFYLDSNYIPGPVINHKWAIVHKDDKKIISYDKPVFATALGDAMLGDDPSPPEDDDDSGDGEDGE